MAPLRVALVYGYWGQNIGNAFFNVGGSELIRKTTGRDPFLVQDAPAYWTLHDKTKGNFGRWWPTIENLGQTDVLVLQGPVLTSYVNEIWDASLRRLRRRGVRVALIGAGMFRFDTDEERSARRFVEEHQPVFVSTRDERTAEVLGGTSVPVHCGLDSVAWLGSNPSIPIIDERLIALTFDHMQEPAIRHLANGEGFVGLGNGSITWERKRRHMRPAEPGARVVMGRSLGWISRRSRYPSRIGDCVAVRPYHRTNPHLPPVVYARPNTVASDEPYTYLGIYRASELTLTDRVHAAAATVVFGSVAVYFGGSGRSSLLGRLSDVRSEGGASVCTPLSQSILDRRMREQETFIGRFLAS